MATKTVHIDGIGEVSLYKRKGARHIRISITAKNEVRVSLPSWTPYVMGIEFAKSKRDWLVQQRRPDTYIQQGQAMGKAHHVQFVKTTGTKTTTRVQGNHIVIGVPAGTAIEDKHVQDLTRKACIRALKQEAEQLLPQRLAHLASQHQFDYASVAIKQLKGRWGSCSSKKEIVLNCFLMNLPWHLIDYVILHELVHTRIMAHGPVFWDEVGKYVPSLSLVRKQMRLQQPTI